MRVRVKSAPIRYGGKRFEPGTEMTISKEYFEGILFELIEDESNEETVESEAAREAIVDEDGGEIDE
ncbi:hypothetical protein [Lacticaseibacillus saniviri]